MCGPIDAKRAVHYLFALMTLLYLVSGLGISEYRAVEPLTGGILTKALSFKIHQLLLVPFVLLLALHMWLAQRDAREKDRNRDKDKEKKK